MYTAPITYITNNTDNHVSETIVNRLITVLVQANPNANIEHARKLFNNYFEHREYIKEYRALRRIGQSHNQAINSMILMISGLSEANEIQIQTFENYITLFHTILNKLLASYIN